MVLSFSYFFVHHLLIPGLHIKNINHKNESASRGWSAKKRWMIFITSSSCGIYGERIRIFYSYTFTFFKDLFTKPIKQRYQIFPHSPALRNYIGCIVGKSYILLYSLNKYYNNVWQPECISWWLRLLSRGIAYPRDINDTGQFRTSIPCYVPVY